MKSFVLAALFFAWILPSQAALIHRYSFNEPTGTVIRDSVGTAHGSAIGGAQMLGTGSLSLDGFNDYVQLPPAIMSGLTEVTFEFWLRWDGGGVWTRIFEFGSGVIAPDGASVNGLDYILLSPHGDSGMLQGALCPLWPYAHLNVAAPYRLPTQEEAHVVLTFSSATKKMEVYHNGIRQGSGESQVPLNAILFNECWLGRSHYQSVFNDPWYRGSFDEFRLYNTVLTEQQLLHSYKAGSERIGAELGALLKLTVTGPSQLIYNAEMEMGDPGKVSLFGDYENQKNVDLTNDSKTSFESANTNVVMISGQGNLVPAGPGTVEITARNQDVTVTHRVTVTLTNAAQLQHRYTFDLPGNQVSDQLGSAHASLVGGGTSAFKNGEFVFAGNNYLDFPNGLLSGFNSFTLEGWFTTKEGLGAAQFPQSLMSFGVSDLGEGKSGVAQSYFEWVVEQGDSLCRFGASTNGVLNEGVQLTWSAPIPGEKTHWAVTYSTNRVHLYLDGVRVATAAGGFLPKSVSDVNNWMGRSNQQGPFFEGTVDEFRIYSGILAPSQVKERFDVGPSVVPGLQQVQLISLQSAGTNWELKINSTQPDEVHGVEKSDSLVQWAPVSEAQLQNKNGNILTFRFPKGTAPRQFFRVKLGL